MFKRQFKQSILPIILIISITLGILVVFQYTLAAWTAPAQTPPNGNTSAPINIGSDIQAKNGSFTVGGILTGMSNFFLNSSNSYVIDLGANNRFRICGPNGACSTAGEYIGGKIRLSSDGTLANAELQTDPGMGGISAPGNVYVGGKVGIGTANPNYNLHIYKPFSETGALFSWGTTNVYLSHGGWGMGAGMFGIGGSSPALTINTSTNNVGIGATNPIGKLHLNSSVADTANAEMITMQMGYSSNGAQKAITWRDGSAITGQIDTRYNGTTVDMVFGHLFNGSYKTSDIMTIKGNGNVGIGTTNPDSPLQVVGAGYPVINLKRTTTATGGGFGVSGGLASGMKLETNTNGVMADGFGGGFLFSLTGSGHTADDGQARIYAQRDGNDDTAAFSFLTHGISADSLKMIIRGNGNVGIGTTNPGYKLDVVGTVKATNFVGNGSGITGIMPSGMIAMFNSSCPSGWTYLSTFENKFVRGGSSYGSTGGSNTHSNGAGTLAGPNHSHTTGSIALTEAQMPIHNHSASGGSVYSNIVQRGASGYYILTDSVSGWTEYGSVTINAASSIGNTGGGAIHNHGNTGLSGTGSITGSTAAADNIPEYITAIFCLKD